MPTYYDFLGISPTAAQDEINGILDQQYNHWRRLTTHHDQETVEKATQALRILEQARATLSDPKSRDKYNASIGLGTHMSGLVDPSASSTVPKIPLVSSTQPLSSATSQQRTDAWMCSRCQTANPIGTRHCKNCGLAIGIDCPNCGRLTEATTKHCSNCGANIQETLRKRKALEDEQRRQSEVQEAERIRMQREQERLRAEQVSEEIVKQKQRQRRSCFTWIFTIVGLLICCVAVSSIMPLALKNIKMPEGIVLQLPTVDPLIAAQSPKFSGTKIGITSRLASVSDNQIRISFEVENLTQSAVTLAFLTSDIVVSDDLGNVFPQQWDTQPIRDELDSSGYSNSKEYTLNLAGSLHPMAKIINVSYPSLSEGEQPFQIAIPLVSVEMVSAGFEAELTDNGGNAMDLKFKFTNNSPYLFVLRLNSSDFLVTDDLGNAYQINEYYSHQALAIALDGANQYSNNQEYQWEYTPGLNPKATLLNIQINLMGQPLSVQIPLSISTEKIRYEAKVLYAYPDSHQFAIGVTVFNLGDADFVLRLDGNQTYITQDGVTFTAQVDNERIGGIIRPGSSTGFQLRFDGNLGNQSNLFLILPLVSGIENIQIPVMPEN